MSNTDGNDSGGGNAPEAQSSDAAASAPEPAPQAAPAEPDSSGVKTPWHLWVVGIVALLWNAIGALDFTATQMRFEFYMSQFTETQLNYFYGFPVWVNVSWAIAVWAAILGSLALLLRRAAAVWLFGLSILGMIVTAIYTMGISNGMEIMGATAGTWIFTLLIWAVAIFLFFYARAMKATGVLK